MDNTDQKEKDNQEVMREALIRISELRGTVTDDKRAKQQMYEDFEKANEGLFGVMRDKQEELTAIEEKLRTVALEEHLRTGEKKLYGGVGIRIAKVLGYDDKEALDWAIGHNMALQLDKRAFEKIAKTTPVECVTITEVPKATIPVKIEIGEMGYGEFRETMNKIVVSAEMKDD